MGIIRFIVRYLLNNEQLINKLADSKPIRQSAKFLVYLFTQSKTTNKLKSSSEAVEILKNLANNMKNELKQIKQFKKK